MNAIENWVVGGGCGARERKVRVRVRAIWSSSHSPLRTVSHFRHGAFNRSFILIKFLFNALSQCHCSWLAARPPARPVALCSSPVLPVPLECSCSDILFSKSLFFFSIFFFFIIFLRFVVHIYHCAPCARQRKS